jgi:hypothetical protein
VAPEENAFQMAFEKKVPRHIAMQPDKNSIRGLHVSGNSVFSARPNSQCDLGGWRVLYGTTYSDYSKFWSAPPLFLEDEDIFQKSATLVQILGRFVIVPPWPIFELHL